MEELELVDPVVLGEKLKSARNAANITQEAAAEALGAARTTLIGIEQGTRRLKAPELMRLADLYGVSAHDLLRPGKIQVDFTPQFRQQLHLSQDSKQSDLWEAAKLLQRLTANYLELEQLHGNLPEHSSVPRYRVTQGSVHEQAEEIAMAERARLGIGISPIADVFSLLENEATVRIFTRKLPSRISAVFGYNQETGGCILVNASHTFGRQSLSVSHEYGHFLTNREAEVLTKEADSKPSTERFADAFANAFLMPALAIRQRFLDVSREKGAFSPASLFYMAYTFHVSVEAIARRLEALNLLPNGTWASLHERGLKVNQIRESLGIPEPPPRAHSPLRMIALAVDAFIQGKLSEGEVAELLAVDRLTARELIDQLGGVEIES